MAIVTKNDTVIYLDEAGKRQGADVVVVANSGAVSPGSDTAGQPGVLVQGAVKTASPTYVDGKTDPISLTMHGGLRMELQDASGDPLDYTEPAIAQIQDQFGTWLDYTTPADVKDVLLTSSDLTAAVLNISAAATTAIVAAAAGQTTRVHRVRINVEAAQKITVKNGAAVLETINFPSAGTVFYDFSSRSWWKTSVNTALNFTTTTTGQVNGVVEYITS